MLKRIAKRLLPSSLWTVLRLARIEYELLSYRKRLVQHEYGGWPLQILLTDSMAAGWYDCDWPVLPEIELLRQSRLHPGATVFNLGAHQCVVALILSNIVGPSGKVVAVEPNEHNIRVARQNREMNNARQLEIVDSAVGKQSGTLVFNRSLDGQVDDGSGAWGRVEVQSTSIDDLAKSHGAPDVVFMDIEGFECAALKGASRALECCPDWLIEVHVGCGLEKLGGSIQKLLSHFPSTDYDLYVRSQSASAFARVDFTAIPHERFFLVALGRFRIV